MIASWRDAQGRHRYNLIVLAAFMAVLALFGGASRADVIGQAIVRVAAILVLFSSAVQFDVASFRKMRAPLFFLIALAMIVALQLVPLPPALWSSLPGREIYTQGFEMAGIEPGWRPLSITPDLTLNSLLALLPAAATLSVLALIPRPYHAAVVPLLLIVIAFSVALGILQIATGAPYLYSITNVGSAVGSFANRNHSALFVALSLPLLAVWATQSPPHDRLRGIRVWIALCAAAAVFPVILVTGSRGGLVLGAISAAGALLILATSGGKKDWRTRVLGISVGAAILVTTAALFIFYSRDEAFQRMFEDSERSELRSNLLPTFMQMIGDFFPVGSGFGSFDPVYRIYEPDQSLGPFYLNQAHNDFAQVVIEGGAAALLLLIGFAIWFAVKAIGLWRAPARDGNVVGRAGTAVIVLIAVSSLFDYPLRTPLISVMLAIAAAWVTWDGKSRPS